MKPKMETCDVCIVGSGPAAHTAAIYTCRANLRTLIFEGWLANGIGPGGQLTTTTEVENFPGFPDGIMGPELCDLFKKQSTRLGAIILSETVVEVERADNNYFIVRSPETTVLCKAVIIATGASAKKMTFEGSDTYWNSGISACAVCDGAAPIFRNKPIVVVGGGDSAMEEALFLTKYASCVYIVHRRDTFRASKIMQDRVFSNPKIKIIWNSEIVKAEGDAILRYITVKDTQNGQETKMECNGLFYAIGHVPASDIVKHLVLVDEQGYIITNPDSSTTNVPGIFAAGDVKDKKWRQAITAAGSGCMAALEAEHYIQTLQPILIEDPRSVFDSPQI